MRVLIVGAFGTVTSAIIRKFGKEGARIYALTGGKNSDNRYKKVYEQYDFSYDNEVICGNTRPKIEGVFGTSLNWKGLSFSLNFRYQLGADVFNEALFNKVENISTGGLTKNQDKRALYERWKEPGDLVRFKDIANAASTPMSSRFVQEENVLTLESVYLGYEFYDGWIQKLGLSNLKVQVSMRDVFRASSIKSERGISYPFARSLEAGLSFNF